MGLNDNCYYYTTDITSTQLWYLGGFHPWLAMLIECPDHKLTPKSCAEAGVGGKGSPQAFGSAGRYPHTCHQATGMIGEKTRPRLLHVRYRRIPMYGSISTGTLPNHQRDPMEGDCLTKPLLRGHVKVGELRTQRPRANRRWKCQHGHHTGMI